jgi:hypothetical protein
MRILLGSVINVKRIDYSFSTIRHWSVLPFAHIPNLIPQIAPTEKVIPTKQ